MRQRGLTLVELMIGVFILILVLGAVMPSVIEWTRNLAIRNAGESLRGALDKARIEALRRNSPMGVWLVVDSNPVLTAACAGSSSGPSWVIAAQDPAGRCDAQPSLTDAPRLVDRWSAADGAAGVVMSTQGADGNAANRVLFTSMGQVAAGDDQLRQIDISHPAGGRVLRVVVEPGGSVRLCDPNASVGDPRRCEE